MPQVQLHFVHFSPEGKLDAEAQRQKRAHISRTYRRRERLKQVEDHKSTQAPRGISPSEHAVEHITAPAIRSSPSSALAVDPFDTTAVRLGQTEQHLLHSFFAEIGPLIAPFAPQARNQAWQTLWLREALNEPISLAATLAHASIYLDSLKGADNALTSVRLSIDATELLRRELDGANDVVSDHVLGAMGCFLGNAIIQDDSDALKVHLPALQGMLADRAAAGRPMRKSWLTQILAWQAVPIHIQLNDMVLPQQDSMLDNILVLKICALFKPVFEECQILASMYDELGANAERYAQRAEMYSTRRSAMEAGLLTLYSRSANSIRAEDSLASFVASAVLMYALCRLRAFGRGTRAFHKLARQLIDAVHDMMAVGQEWRSAAIDRLLLWVCVIAARGTRDGPQDAKVRRCMVKLMSRLWYTSSEAVRACCEEFIWTPMLWTETIDIAVAEVRRTV